MCLQVTITVENGGEKPLNAFIFMVDTALSNKLAFIRAQVGWGTHSHVQ